MNQFVGIQENNFTKLQDQISLFPNPSTNYLNLRINELEFDSGILTLTNILGEEVQASNIHSNSQTFLLNGISKGVYFAKISLTHNSQTYTITKKIMIN
jgi:hypothetical protein